MQAGDKLTFVESFEPLSEERQLSIEDIRESIVLFAVMCKKTLNNFEEDVRSIERFDNGNFITVFELSLKIPAQDGSYLHTVIYGHEDDAKLIDINLSIAEHSFDGINHGGYTYMFTNDGILRTEDPAFDEDEEESVKRSHFNIFDLHEWGDTLREFEISNDPEDNKIARSTYEELEDRSIFDDLEQEMGYDDQPIAMHEVEKLEQLLKDAVLFPPSEYPDAL